MNIPTLYDSLLSKGMYLARIEGYREIDPAPTKHGLRGRVIIDYNLLDTGHIKSEKYIAFISDNSQLRQVFVNVLGELPTPVDMNLLIEKMCIVRIDHNTSQRTNNVFANIVEVLALGDVDEKQLINSKACERIAATKAVFDDDEGGMEDDN